VTDMFSGIWSFIKRHRKKFIFAGVLVGGNTVIGYVKMLTVWLFVCCWGCVLLSVRIHWTNFYLADDIRTYISADNRQPIRTYASADNTVW